jgi:hypothetical protein
MVHALTMAVAMAGALLLMWWETSYVGWVGSLVWIWVVYNVGWRINCRLRWGRTPEEMDAEYGRIVKEEQNDDLD